MPPGKENAQDLLRVRTHIRADTCTCTRKHTGGLRLVGGAPGEGFSRPDLLLPDLGLHKSVPQFPWIKKGGAPGRAGALNTPKTGVLRGSHRLPRGRNAALSLPRGQSPGVLPERSVRSPVTDQVLASPKAPPPHRLSTPPPGAPPHAGLATGVSPGARRPGWSVAMSPLKANSLRALT